VVKTFRASGPHQVLLVPARSGGPRGAPRARNPAHVARRGAAGGPPHGCGMAPGGLASCHQDHLVGLGGLPRYWPGGAGRAAGL